MYNSTTKKCEYVPGIDNAINGMCCMKEESWIVYNSNKAGTTKNPSIAEDTCFIDYLNDENVTITKADDFQWQRNVFLHAYFSNIMLRSEEPLCNIGKKLDNVILESDTVHRKCDIYSLEYMYACAKVHLETHCDGYWYHGTAKEFHLVEMSNLAEVFRYKDQLSPQLYFIRYLINMTIQRVRLESKKLLLFVVKT